MIKKEKVVLLCAMSGVRVADPGLQELGLTLPGFVDRGRAIAQLPTLGLLTLAAHLPENLRPVYLEIEGPPEDAMHSALAHEPDLALISSLAPRIDEAYRLADRFTQAGIPVALGGLHATACPQDALKHVNAVVCGDGEPVLNTLVDDLLAGRSRGVYQSRTPFDLARSRVPRYDLIEPGRYDRLTLQTSRGCPYACEFCGASRLLGPHRTKPLDRIRLELAAALERSPRGRIELADDNTFHPHARALDLVDLLGRSGARWFTETDITIADHPALLDRIAASGCTGVLIGLESPGIEGLIGMDPARFKERRLASYERDLDRIQSAGIPVTGCFVLGLDTDGPDAFATVLEASEAWGLAEVQITIQTPFAGTELARRLAASGRLDSDAGWDRYTLFDLTYRPARMSAKKLTEEFRWLMTELYRPDRTDRRQRIRKKIYRRAVTRRRASRAGASPVSSTGS